MSPFNLQHNAGDYCLSTDGETESGRLHDLFKTTEPVSSSSSSDSSQVFFPQGSCSFRVPDFPNRVPPVSICEATGLRGFSDPRLRKRDAAGQFSGCSESSSGGRWSSECFLATSNSCGDLSPGPLWVNRWLKIAQRCGCVCAETG